MELLGEVGSAWRAMRRRPVHSALAVGILALGLTAGMGVFTYVNGFRQPFPGADPRGLVQLHHPTGGDPFGDLSYLDYLDYAGSGEAAFRGMAAVSAGYAASIRHESSTEVVFLEAVSGSYFPVLDVGMALGRGLRPDDDRRGADPVAVIAWSWWQRQWAGDPGILGSVVYFNYRPYTVVGVAAPEFHGSLASFRPEAWLPFAPFADRYTSWAGASELRDRPLVRAYARLGEGVGRQRAEAVLRGLGEGLDQRYPRAETGPREPFLTDATWIDPRARTAEAETLRIMLVAAGAFLLLVCANVANLLLASGLTRRREMAVRGALGASRGRIFRQVLVESLLLAAAAGLVALALAGPVALRLGSFFARPSVWGENVARTMTVDPRVLIAGVAAAVAACLLAGMMPGLAAARGDLAEILKSSGSSAPPPSRLGALRLPGARELMVAAQAALAVVLLGVASLTLRTLDEVSRIDPGFDAAPMVASYVSTSSTGVTVEQRDGWFRELARRLEEEPWVRAATVSGQAPLSAHPSARFQIESGDAPVEVTYANVIPGYFATLGIATREGRTFENGDTLGAPLVAVVNEAFVRRHLAGARGSGTHLRRADDAQAPGIEIVGVVADARIEDLLAEPEPVVYLSNPQQGYPSGSALTVAVNGDPAAAALALRRWLRAYESHVAIVNVIPYAEVMRGFTYVQRMNAQMFSALAILGLVLSAAGIFSVLTLAVAQRTREIGVRMALGADRGDVGIAMLSRTAAAVVLGLVLGGLVSLGGARLARSLIFGVTSGGPGPFLAASAVFLVVALGTMAGPLLRATAVDPVRSLRSE